MHAREKGAALALRRHFKKTYKEVPGWCSVYQAFYRVYVFHAVLLHLSFSVAFYGWDWSALSTWCITHSVLKGLRQAVYMWLVWDLKKGDSLADGDKEARFARARFSAQQRRTFNAFRKNGFLRILLFAVLPIAYVVEKAQRYFWSLSSCGSADEWCADNLKNGVPAMYVPACVASDGQNFLAEYCVRCSPTAALDQSAISLDGDCPALTYFANDCLGQCASSRASNHIFQAMAVVYTVVFVGAYFIFGKPGAMGEFQWGRSAKGPIGLGTQYIGTPELLRVPTKTAVLYYLTWAVCLSVKIVFGYYALVQPLVVPFRLLMKADFRCWTPWSGDSTGNPQCAYIVDGVAGGTLGELRGLLLKVIVITLRMAVPCIMYFLDTYLWFSFTTGFFSTLVGRYMGLGQVKDWGDLVMSFAESCHLFNEKLLAGVTPAADAFHREGLELLELDISSRAYPTLHPAAQRRAVFYDDRQPWVASPSRGTLCCVAALGSRVERAGALAADSDHLSNSERDAILLAAPPGHVDFFGVPEYIVFPAMLAARLLRTALAPCPRPVPAHRACPAADARPHVLAARGARSHHGRGSAGGARDVHQARIARCRRRAPPLEQPLLLAAAGPPHACRRDDPRAHAVAQAARERGRYLQRGRDGLARPCGRNCGRRRGRGCRRRYRHRHRR